MSNVADKKISEKGESRILLKEEKFRMMAWDVLKDAVGRFSEEEMYISVRYALRRRSHSVGAGKKSGSLSEGVYRYVSVDLDQISEYKLYIQISLLAFNCTSPQHTYANVRQLMKFAL